MAVVLRLLAALAVAAVVAVSTLLAADESTVASVHRNLALRDFVRRNMLRKTVHTLSEPAEDYGTRFEESRLDVLMKRRATRRQQLADATKRAAATLIAPSWDVRLATATDASAHGKHGVKASAYGVKASAYGVATYDGRRLEEAAQLQLVRRPRAARLREDLRTHSGLLPSVDLVVSRYDEDSSWLADVERELPMVRLFVYEKGGRAGVASACNLLSSRATCTPLENVGREAHTYLTHLVERYDGLAAKTVFVQGGAPGYGFGPGLSGGHLMPNSDFYFDYLAPTTPPRCVYTFAIANRADRGVLLRRADFPLADELNSLSAAPALIDELPASCGAKWVVQSNTTEHFWEALRRDGIVAKDDRPRASNHVAFWSEYLEAALGPLPRGYTPFANGATLSVGRDQLRKHPKEFYVRLLGALSDVNFPAAAIYLEIFWANVLGHESQARECARGFDWLLTRGPPGDKP